MSTTPVCVSGGVSVRIAVLFLASAAATIPSTLSDVGFEFGIPGAAKQIEIFGDFQCPGLRSVYIWLIAEDPDRYQGCLGGLDQTILPQTPRQRLTSVPRLPATVP